MTIEETKAKIFSYLCTEYRQKNNEYVDSQIVMNATGISRDDFNNAVSELANPAGGQIYVAVEHPSGRLKLASGGIYHCNMAKNPFL